MNGCILIGTLDGVNVKIRQEVGEENFFLFGARAHEIAGLRKERAEGKVMAGLIISLLARAFQVILSAKRKLMRHTETRK
ncbi:hypothetical protein AB3S75_036194 [Citrus x aurantiifolia]